ncbi:unnamed protein product [Symbiodinium sp. CCMP2592]|nr:unnamed protein product [Symbiodinium sp. CCMP2592]
MVPVWYFALVEPRSTYRHLTNQRCTLNPKPYTLNCHVVSSARPVVEEVPELPEPHHGSRFAGLVALGFASFLLVRRRAGKSDSSPAAEATATSAKRPKSKAAPPPPPPRGKGMPKVAPRPKAATADEAFLSPRSAELARFGKRIHWVKPSCEAAMLPQQLETQLGNPHCRLAVPRGVEDPVPTEHPKALLEVAERDEFANLWVNFASKMQASRPGILHGVRASQVLHHLPWAWLRRDLNSLYALSQETAKFDQFWSHSWKGALWAKYINLLYLQTCLAANIAGTLSASLALGLVSAEFLGARRGFCLVFGFLSFCFAPWLWRSRRIVFLDIFCIHQKDQQLKAEAIMSMGAFLKQSDSMLVLWDPSWVARLWCVFEIAAFLHSRAKGSKAVLQIIPPLLGPALLGGEILFCLACIVYAYSETALASSEDSKFSAAIHLAFFGVLGIPCSFFVSHSLRGYARSVETLKEQLSEFKAAGTRSACCEQGHEGEAVVLCDREILFQCIAHWYGSVDEFETQVQSEVRTALTDQLADNAISYQRILLLFTPYVWLRFEYAATHANDPIRQIVELARTLTYWLAVFPFMNKLLFRLCYRFRAQCCMLRWDVLLSMLIVVATFLFYFICYIIQVYVFRQNDHELLPSVISVVSWLSFTAIMWRLT